MKSWKSQEFHWRWESMNLSWVPLWSIQFRFQPHLSKFGWWYGEYICKEAKGHRCRSCNSRTQDTETQACSISTKGSTFTFHFFSFFLLKFWINQSLVGVWNKNQSLFNFWFWVVNRLCANGKLNHFCCAKHKKTCYLKVFIWSCFFTAEIIWAAGYFF